MSNWSGGVLTNVGRELQLKVEAGATLTFTKIKLGDGIESLEAVDDLTDLMSPKFVMGISSKSVANDVCKITGVLSSSSIATGFRAREWGLFAQDPDIGEILYMISIDTQPDWVPSGSDIGKLAVSYAMNVAVSNASSITARIDPAGLVTADMLAELIHETQYNKSYNVGDYAFTGYGLPAWAYLECIQEGISGTIELDLSNVVEGEHINDGTVVWIVRNWHSIHQYLVEATGYGIVSGLQVKAQSTPNMTVSIEGGTVHMKNGTRIVIAAIAALTIATADATNPRIDSIYVDGTGNVAYAQGTPAATPVAPTLSTDAIKLADVKVAANQSSVTDANIIRNGEVKARYQNAGVVDVKDFGAKGDGVTDDTAAFKRAIIAAEGKTLLVPHGNYNIGSNIFAKNVFNVNDLGIYANIKPVFTASKIISAKLNAVELVGKIPVIAGSIQAMTYDSLRNQIIIGHTNDSTQYIEKIDFDSLQSVSTNQFSELGHINSLDYIASNDTVLTGSSKYLNGECTQIIGDTGLIDGAVCYDAEHQIYFLNHASRTLYMYDMNKELIKSIDSSAESSIVDNMFNGMIEYKNNLLVSGLGGGRIYIFDIANYLQYKGTINIGLGEFEDLFIKDNYIYGITSDGELWRITYDMPNLKKLLKEPEGVMEKDFNNNGFIKFESGLIMQWGLIELFNLSPGYQNKEITYPSPFKHKAFFTIAQVRRGSTVGTIVGMEPHTTTSGTLYFTIPEGVTVLGCNYVAFGY